MTIGWNLLVLLIALGSVAIAFLVVWLSMERSPSPRARGESKQSRRVLVELFGSVVCLLAFVKDRHSVSGGFLGVASLLLLVQAIYTILKYATRSGAEPEYRPPGAPPPIEKK